MIGGRVLASGPTVEVLTRDTIRELYHVEADIEAHGASGGLIVVPTRRSAS
jgi:ABC-type cobalamin/Fe3+-siderophores transport system ATPase subunit